MDRRDKPRGGRSPWFQAAEEGCPAKVDEPYFEDLHRQDVIVGAQGEGKRCHSMTHSENPTRWSGFSRIRNFKHYQRLMAERQSV